MNGTDPVVGTILAGGKGRRMQGRKPLIPFLGRPLITHVIERLAPQVDDLWLSVGADHAWAAASGFRLIVDDAAFADAGPLAGIVAALAEAQRKGFCAIAVAPCDSPLIPLDLVARLSRSLRRSDRFGAVASSAAGLHPTISMWTIDAIAPLTDALRSNRVKLQALVAECHITIWDAEADGLPEHAFFNANDPASLKAGERLAASDAMRLSERNDNHERRRTSVGGKMDRR